MHSRMTGNDVACMVSSASQTEVYTSQASAPSIVHPAAP